MEMLLQLDRIGKNFRSHQRLVTALQAVSINIDKGEFVSIIGPSGCGKSTLLKIVAGLIPYDEGWIQYLWDRDRYKGNDIGFVFQEPVLLPWKDVLDNARFPADMFGWDKSRYNEIARQLLELVGLGSFEHAFPHELSGGMRQRVSIVRAWTYDPPLLLMDEPFGALDMLTREHLNDLLMDLWARDNKTVLFVTHSVEEAVFLSDRVIVMSARPGRISSDIKIDLPRPRNKSTRDKTVFYEYIKQLRTVLGNDAHEV